MKKTTLTEKKAEETPTGGVLVGKRKGQTIIHDKGTMSGYLVGRTHAEGGIKAVNKATGQPLEMQGGEVVITAPAVSDQTKNEFNGKMLTNREILSQINVNGGGVAFAKDGMEIPKNLKHTGATYSYGGKTMTDHEIYEYITGGNVNYVSYKDKYNKKYNYSKNKSHTLEEISKDTGISMKGLQQIYNKGIGAYKTNPSSVRPNVKSKEQWAMARVYSAVMGGKASKVDSNELKMKTGGHLAKGKTLSQIAKMHNVTLKQLQSQVNMGMKAESEHTSSKREQMKIVKDHLVENPKYYSLLKKAGLKKGGSLVRDAKSGNTPARDLNNYNDVLDIDADGFVGAETGLFAFGGDVDFDVDGTGGADASSGVGAFVKGGITDVVVNNWNDIPDTLKNVRLPKKVDYDINPDNDGLNEILKPFLSSDNNRPAMQGFNYDDNGLTVTDAFIMLTIPTTQTFFSGIYKPKEINTKINETFPDYKRIIPLDTEIKREFYIDVLQLLTYCKVAINYSDNRQIVFKADDTEMYFDPSTMIVFLISLIKLTGQTYWSVGYVGNRKPLIFTKSSSYKLGEDIIGLIMPFLSPRINTYGAENEGKNVKLNVYFDFDNNEIVNADGSIVDLNIKPVKTRAKRTTKATTSQTSSQIDLLDKKIWVKDNPDLSRRVQELAFANGFINIAGKKVYNIQFSNIYFGEKSGRKYMFILDYDKDAFDKETEKEIFESDLFGNANTNSSQTNSQIVPVDDSVVKIVVLDKDKKTIASADNVYSLLDILVEEQKKGGSQKYFEYNYYDKSKYPPYFSVWIENNPSTNSDIDPSNTTIYELEEWLKKQTDLQGQPFNLDYFFSKSGASNTSTPTSGATTSSKFSSGEIDMFNRLDKIINENNFSIASNSTWSGGTDTQYFVVSNDVTGEVFPLRSFGNRLGRVLEDVNNIKSRELLLDFKDWKATQTNVSESTTTSTSSQTSSQKSPVEEEDWAKKFTADLDKLVFAQGDIELLPELSKEQKDLNDLIKLLPSFQQSKYAVERAKILNEIKKLHYKLTYEGFIKPNEASSSDADLFTPQGLLDYYFTQATQNPTAELEPACELPTPNGEKSKLPMSAYLNVRTQQFKNWFGDWEKAYETGNYVNCSKMIDPDTKEPKIYFHGVRKYVPNFGQFSNMGQGVVRPYGAFEPPSFPASYFAGEEDYAKFYGGVAENMPTPSSDYKPFIYKVFLSVKNPISLLPLDFMLSYKDFMDYIYVGYGVKIDPNQELLKALDNDLTKKNPMWIYVRRDIGFIEKLKDYGYDAIFQMGDIPTFLPNGEVETDRTKYFQEVEYLTFYPSQVKSATVKKSFYFDFFNDIRFKNGGYVCI